LPHTPKNREGLTYGIPKKRAVREEIHGPIILTACALGSEDWQDGKP
jgi:hypothetical protein